MTIKQLIEKYGQQKQKSLEEIEGMFGKDFLYGLVLGLYNNVIKDLEQLEQCV